MLSPALALALRLGTNPAIVLRLPVVCTGGALGKVMSPNTDTPCAAVSVGSGVRAVLMMRNASGVVWTSVPTSSSAGAAGFGAVMRDMMAECGWSLEIVASVGETVAGTG